MALLGHGALAMWWDMAPAMRAEFEDWHSHEHFPERMRIPGFRRGTRWLSATGDEAVFVLYEVEAHDTLSSGAYAAHLNAPTPWSTTMMPHHRNMVRSQCHVVATRGGAVARHALTLRFSTSPGGEADVRTHLQQLVGTLPSRPGAVGAHLLRHETPALPRTTEQEIRKGADRVAEHVVVVCGYDRTALEELTAASANALPGLGAVDLLIGVYSLSYSATRADVA